MPRFFALLLGRGNTEELLPEANLLQLLAAATQPVAVDSSGRIGNSISASST
jgi:hypothetical protein